MAQSRSSRRESASERPSRDGTKRHPPAPGPKQGGPVSFDFQKAADGRSAIHFIAWFALTISVAACVALVSHAMGSRVPGCGPSGGCDHLARSVWGTLPVVGISTASAGLAWYAGVWVWWVVAVLLAKRAVIGGFALGIAAVGAVVAIVLSGAMVAERALCPYCVAAHAGGLLFAGCVVWIWRVQRRSGVARAASGNLAMIAGGVALLAGVGLFVLESNAKEKTRREADSKLRESVATMTNRQAAPLPAPATTAPSTSAVAPASTSNASASASPEAAGAATFAGRYREGPESAQIRIVLWTDYQCPDCKNMESQLDRAIELAKSQNVSLHVSSRHFPFSTVCNRHLKQDMHPDACFGAFAAEAAGRLGGAEAFWATHRWLFSRNGQFTPALLREHAATIGVNADAMLKLMEDASILQLVKDDIEAGITLGLRQTPFVLINGVELQGWNAEDALVRAVRALAATNPAASTGGGDRAPSATEKFMAEWREGTIATLPDRLFRRALGPADAAVRVVVIGDYEEPGTVEADAVLRPLTSGDAGIRYSFVPFPVDQTCNPAVPLSRYKNGCAAAKLAAAADASGGADAYWKAHNLLMLNSKSLASVSAELLATEIGVDAKVLAEALTQPFVAEELRLDVTQVGELKLTSIPAIYVNGKLVRNWKVGERSILAEIVRAAR